MEFLTSINSEQWFILGSIILIIDILILSTSLLFLVGLSGILVACILYVYPIEWEVQWILFGVFSFVFCLLNVKLNKQTRDSNGDSLNDKLNSLIGSKALTGSSITEMTGHIIIGGVPWAAISEDGSEIEIGQLVIVTGIESNTLIVKGSKI